MSTDTEDIITLADTAQRERWGNNWYRRLYYDLENKRSVLGDPLNYTTYFSEEEEEQSTDLAVFLLDQSDTEGNQGTLFIDNTAFPNGWSPTLNKTTVAFFSNFQCEDINWRDLYPNTRIPIAFTTSPKELEDCLVIVVDLEHGDQVSPVLLPNLPHDTSSVLRRTGKDETQNYEYNQDVSYSNNLLSGINVALQEDDEGNDLLWCYYNYVNSKRGSLKNINFGGIDKYSSNYHPNKNKRVQYGTCYSIKSIGDTFVNHLIGTVGFSVAEYYRGDTKKESYKSSYNICQVVHGHKFKLDTPITSNCLRKYNTHKYPKGIVRSSFYNKNTGWYNVETRNPKIGCVFVEQLLSLPVTAGDKDSLRNIINYRAVPHPPGVVAPPILGTPDYLVDKARYRKFRLWQGTLKSKPKFKVFKNIKSKPYNPKSKNQQFSPGHPVDITSKVEHDKNLRNWYYKHLAEWVQLEDPENYKQGEFTNPHLQSFPLFKKDFYNVKYIINREE
jgi:hypothetical protein